MRLNMNISVFLLCLPLRDGFSFVNHQGARIIARSSSLTKLKAATDTDTSSKTNNKATSFTRKQRSDQFFQWVKGNSNKIQVADSIGIDSVPGAASSDQLGLIAGNDLKSGDLILQVPSNLVVEVATGSSLDSSTLDVLDYFPSDTNKKNVYRYAPWWAQMSLKLNLLDKGMIRLGDTDMRPWLDFLPRKFDTPIHWSLRERESLQYNQLAEAVQKQEETWRALYDDIINAAGSSSEISKKVSYDDFVWGAENARSRAFSGAFSGSAFSPIPYAFTLILVGAYVGLNLGPLEEAANGAAIVICGTIIKDFVLPKLLKQKKYAVCPLIDVANHYSMRPNANVAFEYFGDGYSLGMTANVGKGEEVAITYGPRSNDQLLQYYGFIEENNPSDVYIMPPIREWDIDLLEKRCGRQFDSGRLQMLDRAGLLGYTEVGFTDDEVGNEIGGVVISRASGIDPAIVQAIRVMVATDAEWEEGGAAIGNFAEMNAAGAENERIARIVAKTAIEEELASKATTIDQDKDLLNKARASKSMEVSAEEQLAIQFRIEKKKVLQEILTSL